MSAGSVAETQNVDRKCSTTVYNLQYSYIYTIIYTHVIYIYIYLHQMHGYICVCVSRYVII